MTKTKLPGDKSKDQYTLTEELGRGGFGYVYKARDKYGPFVAIKIFQNIPYLTDDRIKTSWESEMRLGVSLKHKNIIDIFDFRKENIRSFGEIYYLVMEWADKGNISDLIQSKKLGGSLYPEKELLFFYSQILDGMEEIHKSFLHRDIKAENILLVDDVVKIADFGLSKQINTKTRSKSFKGWGSLKYMAPEIWLGKNSSKVTDIYSLGVVFYYLATLELPFSSADEKEMEELHRFGRIPSVKEKNKILSNRLDGIISKMMKKSASERYQNIDEIKDDLEQISVLSKVSIPSSPLVSKMKSLLKDQEQKEIEESKKKAEYERTSKMVEYEIDNMVGLVNGILSDLNKEVPETSITLRAGTKMDHTLIWNKSDLLRFSFNPRVFSGDLKIGDKKVYASCEISLCKGRLDEGINLILHKNDDDEYGEWKVLIVNSSPLINKKQYPRLASYHILNMISSGNDATIVHSIRGDVRKSIEDEIESAIDLQRNPRDPSDNTSEAIEILF